MAAPAASAANGNAFHKRAVAMAVHWVGGSEQGAAVRQGATTAAANAAGAAGTTAASPAGAPTAACAVSQRATCCEEGFEDRCGRGAEG